MKTLDEWLIIDICNSIRERPSWENKYKDPEISSKWKSELKDTILYRTENVEEIISYAFRELQWVEYLEKTFPGVEENGFHIGIDDKIVYSDKVIDANTKADFIKAVERFSDQEFRGEYDYHPGSNNQVVDLVHPSLYSLQYNVTPVFTNPQKEPTWWELHNWKSEEYNVDRTFGIAQYDEAISKVKKNVDDYGISRRFQWIPTVLETRNYSFRSYINNLHPVKYQDLYEAISQVIRLLAPGINLCLSRLSSGPISRISLPMDDSLATEEWQIKLDKLMNPGSNPETGKEIEVDWAAVEAFEKTKKYNFRKFPPIYERDPPVNYSFDVRTYFDELKVIVKLANIELTSEKPRYNGGSWHVEGTINEDIVATLIYYYDCENISGLTLSFKSAYEDPYYEQDDKDGVEKFYGLHDEDKLTKEIGKMETKEDRVLIFPNWFQHHVDPFELNDNTKPGHRKMLCLFFVDPFNSKVISTDMVPPQQKDWWNDGTDLSEFGLNEFTKEQIENSLKGRTDDENMEWPISLENAKVIRQELMKERGIPKEDKYSEAAFTRRFTLCEH